MLRPLLTALILAATPAAAQTTTFGGMRADVSAPVEVAAVTGYFVAHAFEPLPLGVGVGTVGDVLGRDLAIATLLGMLAALTDRKSVV